jgi:predicted GNAT superfamily acetyltransferase
MIGGVEIVEVSIVDDAFRDAGTAAAKAGVDIRALQRADELLQVTMLFGEIWHVEGDRELIERDLLVAMAHAGNYVVGAYDGDRMVGACVGFFGEPIGRSLHSHIAGVVAGLAGRGIGTAMKQHQRVWCLQRGITQITWTFDPLVARNAAFNLLRLGARVDEYLVEFYGPMNDSRNLGQPSDRLWVVWDLDASARTAPVAELSGRVSVVLSASADGAPVSFGIPGRAAQATVRIPSDIEALRTSDPGLAGRWRYAARDAMTGLFDAGWVVAGFDRSGAAYIFERTEERGDR